MMLCASLAKMQKRYVDFDPQNKSHLEAYSLLALGVVEDNGSIRIRQHATLRFHLEAPFVDVPSMMHYKVGHAYLNLFDNVRG
jgi:hypothetical protein